MTKEIYLGPPPFPIKEKEDGNEDKEETKKPVILFGDYNAAIQAISWGADIEVSEVVYLDQPTTAPASEPIND